MLWSSLAGAIFDPARAYRYLLWRTWDDLKPTLLCLMLNPSIADETGRNDPTVTRCISRAHALGFGRILVGNLFALVSTHPAALRQVDDPIGPANDAHICAAAEQATTILCAWGRHGTLFGRDRAVLHLLREHQSKLHALKVLKGGQPQHPLYVALDQPLLSYPPDR